MRRLLEGPVDAIAERLLGWTLTHGGVSGRIVEVEAYGAADDAASHSFRGKTPRNQSMFEAPGTLYVYLIYGMHLCANVATGPAGEGSAVLIRALEPISGIEQMYERRPKATTEFDLCSGPGKLCAALGITAEHDGVGLLDDNGGGPHLVAGELLDDEGVAVGPRIGISKEVERPWRFAISGNRFMSRPLLRS